MHRLFTTKDVFDARRELLNNAQAGRAPTLESAPLAAWQVVQSAFSGNVTTKYPSLVPLKHTYKRGRQPGAELFQGFAIRGSCLVFDEQIHEQMDQTQFVAIGLHGNDLEIAFRSPVMNNCWALPVRKRDRRYIIRLDPWRHLSAMLRLGSYQLDFVDQPLARVAIARNALKVHYRHFTNLRPSWARPGTTSWDLPKLKYGPQPPLFIPGLP